MPHSIKAFICVLIFSLIHLGAAKIRLFSTNVQRRFLSFGGGVALTYVFLDILPKLGESELLIKKVLDGAFPYLERHVYILALTGFLLFFLVERHSSQKNGGGIWVSLSAYAIFNFFVGYAVMDKNNPEVRPLALFAFAMALHYFTNDFALCTSHGDEYGRFEKWILTAFLFAGWLVGTFFVLPGVAIALVSAFIGGGIMMNVVRHELPTNKTNSINSFLLACAFYSIILLSVGE